MDVSYTFSPLERPDFKPVSALFLRSQDAACGGEEDSQLDRIGIVFVIHLFLEIRGLFRTSFLLAVVLVLP